MQIQFWGRKFKSTWVYICCKIYGAVALLLLSKFLTGHMVEFSDTRFEEMAADYPSFREGAGRRRRQKRRRKGLRE